MKTTDSRFQEASRYAFKKVFPALTFPVQELLNNAAALEEGSAQRKALLSAACIMVFAGLKTLTKFHNFGTDLRDDVENFVGLYFPETYRWQYKKLYRAYEQGLLHYLGHEHVSEHAVIFTDHEDTAAFGKTFDKILHVNVPVFFVDFQTAVKNFADALNSDEGSAYRDSYFRNYQKILAACVPG